MKRFFQTLLVLVVVMGLIAGRTRFRCARRGAASGTRRPRVARDTAARGERTVRMREARAVVVANGRGAAADLGAAGARESVKACACRTEHVDRARCEQTRESGA